MTVKTPKPLTEYSKEELISRLFKAEEEAAELRGRIRDTTEAIATYQSAVIEKGFDKRFHRFASAVAVEVISHLKGNHPSQRAPL
jgi:vacuolar-type H+-ATPase subunit D/Vma8